MEIGNLPEKLIQNNDGEYDPGSQKKKGEDARNVQQRTKEQTEMNSKLEGIIVEQLRQKNG